MYDEDKEYSSLATMTEAVREYAFNVGSDRPDVAWILSPYDTWERNPFYVGPKQPHPEDAMYGDFDEDFDDESLEAVEAPEVARVTYEDDDIHF